MTDSTSEFVELKQGPTVPLAAYLLALRLEDAGLVLRAQGGFLRVSTTAGEKPSLSPEDADQIRQWKPHLMMLADYRAPDL